MKLDKPNRRIQDLLAEIEKVDLVPVFSQNFVDQDIYLDGRDFVDCNSKNCRLFAHLGHLRFSGKCNFDGSGFHFQYPASVVWDITVKTKSQPHSSQ